ncbi:MAG: sulfurtransferase [Anaerolineae bacterium]|nr:sulfurtransferase [Anaerolineae bacterium]
MTENKRWAIAVVFAAVLLAAFILGGCGPAATPTPTPAVEVGFANPQLLVETDWLAEHLKDADLRVVDARKAEDYRAGHIASAIIIPRPDTFDPEAPKGIIGQPEQIATLFGGKGIDEKVHVVVYDEGKNTAASRVFWTLEYYGHPSVSVLNGGFTKWQAEGRELTTEEPVVTSVTFTAKADESKLSTKEQIMEDIGKEGVVMLDARSPEEYRGEDVRAKRGGHIPGAVNIDWVENFTAGEVPVFKSAAELTQLYEAAGVTKDKLVHAY